MESQNAIKGRSIGAALAVAAFGLLTAGWSATALGRTQTDAECDGGAHDIATFDPPAVTLHVVGVDHVAIRSDASTLDTAELESKGDDTAATPLLRLAPRVSSALRDVFDDLLPAGVEETSLDLPASPVAESEDVKEAAESVPDENLPASQPGEDIDLPLLQRRMFRTDI